jgi:hypothetical protein
MSEMADPSPRVIVGVTRADQERAFKLGGKHQITVPNRADLVVVDSYIPDQKPLFNELMEQQVLRPGIVLVQSPFISGTYSDETEAELRFERQQLQLVAQLCQILGATHVKSERSSLNVKTVSTSTRVKVQKKAGRLIPWAGEGSVKTEESEKWEQRLAVNDQFDGGPPAIEEARRFLERYSLDDPEIVSLVELRAGGLKKREITVSYAGREDKNLTIAAGVKLPQVALSGNVRRDHSIRKEVSLRIEVTFSD